VVLTPHFRHCFDEGKKVQTFKTPIANGSCFLSKVATKAPNDE
jgi:hypothetical protein